MKLRNYKIIMFVLAGVLFLCASPICAETIILKSGKSVEGKLIERTDKYIKIDFQGVPLTYFVDEIESIDGQKVAVEEKETGAVTAEENKGTGKIPEEVSPNEIFEKVIAAYRSMETYKAKGTVSSDIEVGGMKTTISTEFSILLKKPNLYLISWTQKNMSVPVRGQSGAVWSDGTQPYLYMGIMNAYSKMVDDQVALAGATGISGGAAFTVPPIFLSVFKKQESPFKRLTNAKLEKAENVGDEDCYVISASSSNSMKEIFWISKSKCLIIKCFRSVEVPKGILALPEKTDEQLEKAIKGMGQEVTAESKQRMREIMNKSREALNSNEMKGSFTELHVQISSPKLSTEDFQFVLPEGTVLKESLFGRAFGGGK